MYNVFTDSKYPDPYPMNQLSDMWTNWIGMMVGCAILIIGVNPMIAIILGGILMVVALLGVAKLCKNKNTPYGYFGKFH